MLFHIIAVYCVLDQAVFIIFEYIISYILIFLITLFKILSFFKNHHQRYRGMLIK